MFIQCFRSCKYTIYMILDMIAREKYKYAKVHYNNQQRHSDKKWHLCGQKRSILWKRRYRMLITRRVMWIRKTVFSICNSYISLIKSNVYDCKTSLYWCRSFISIGIRIWCFLRFRRGLLPEKWCLFLLCSQPLWSHCALAQFGEKWRGRGLRPPSFWW